MKAFLLAAGHGMRLRPLTDHTAKCLLPIRGEPLLEIWLRLCHRHAINEVLINIHSHASKVTDYLAEHHKGMPIKVMVEPRLLGSAGTVWANRDWVSEGGSFWIFYADVLTRADLTAMLRFHQSRSARATLGVTHVADPTRCGIVEADEENTLQSFIEKPENPRSNLAFSGVMLATSQIFDLIPPDYPADFGFDVLPRLVGLAKVYEISDYLVDIGTKENYEAVQTTWPGL